MTTDFDRRVNAIIQAEAAHRAGNSRTIRFGQAPTSTLAAEYLRVVRPQGVDLFSVLAEHGVPVHAGDPTGRDRNAQYIRLSPSGTLENPDASHGGKFFFEKLKYLHANGLLIDRPMVRNRPENPTGDGGVGAPLRPPRGTQADSHGVFQWYDEADLITAFGQEYVAFSSGLVSSLTNPQRHQPMDNRGFLHVDGGTVYAVWEVRGGEGSTIGNRLADHLRIETLTAYLTRVAAHEVGLQAQRSRR